MDNKEEFLYEEEQVYKSFDFINKDLDLLFLLIFIEAFKANKQELNFIDFFKGNYWDIDHVAEEVLDTNDYMSIPDMVIEQVVFIFEDTRMGKIVEIGIDNTDYAIKDLLIEVAKIGKENAAKEAPYYQTTFDQVYFLSDQKSLQIKAELEKNPQLVETGLWRDKSVFFTKEQGYFRALQSLIIDTPQHIIIRVKYNESKIKEIEKDIAVYLDDFIKDKYITELPRYQEKRPYFAQQIENFYRYVNRLNLIGDVVNIPFTALSENGFEVVKILYFLQLNGAIKMRWSDEGSWKVQFTKLPITPENLLGIEDRIIQIDTRPKTDLSLGLDYNGSISMLTIGEYAIKINGPEQKEFLKIVFKDKKELSKEWFFSEISELYDFAMKVNDKKFYNAAYQVNLKIAQKTPIKDFLITTKQSVRINPKYL